MNKEKIITQLLDFMKDEMKGNDAGHDYWHIYRVWNLAKTIWEKEKCDLFIVELWAILHDIADHKFYNGDESIAPKKARNILEKLEVEEEIIQHVENIVKNVSYSSNLDKDRKYNSIELQIVQDADMLDAIWAIWIWRTFTYWGAKWRQMYNPQIEPKLNMSKEEYRNNKWPTINHFYEKLLKLKDLMNTKTWRRIAEQRHKFMEVFLEEFLLEWEGKR